MSKGMSILSFASLPSAITISCLLDSELQNQLAYLAPVLEES